MKLFSKCSLPLRGFHHICCFYLQTHCIRRVFPSPSPSGSPAEKKVNGKNFYRSFLPLLTGVDADGDK